MSTDPAPLAAVAVDPLVGRCYKRRYDKIGAKLALAAIRKRRNGWKTEQRSYWCDECKSYHLTSRA